MLQNLITKSSDLVTSREETRVGFISMALEKNYIALPYVEEAKTLKALASRASKPIELLGVENLRLGLLTASGLSDKALKYLTYEDKVTVIKGLIEEFLEPAGDKFIDELVYRYLFIKGDALGGKARNLAGSLGERKFLRSLLSVLNLTGINYKWLDNESTCWVDSGKTVEGIEKRIKSIHWTRSNKDILLIMNTNVPLVKKNVDFIVLNGKIEEIKRGKESIIHFPEKYLALGELKCGIDPAGADEHWKTANSALNRIRNAFAKKDLKPFTFFVGAVIENSMAKEIFNQLNDGTLNNAANLTHDAQLTATCNWIINL